MDDDMILPDDYSETPTEEIDAETQETAAEDFETVETGEDTKPSVDDEEAQEEPQETPRTLKLKYNHEEREVTEDEARELAQKGLNYEKAVERAKQESAQQARDAVIADMGMIWNGKPITTETEYKQALAEQKLIEQYKDRDLPPEVVQELIENRRFREEQQRERAEKEQQAQKQAEYNEFFKYFESVNDRAFDPAKDTLPKEVTDAVEQGQPLKFAYMDWHARELRNQLKIARQNQANLKKAPVGSVTAGGGVKTEAEDDFLAGFNSIS